VARQFRDGGHLHEALASYEAARRLWPAHGGLGTELADLYARIGLRDLAIGEYRRVLRAEPDHAGARRGLAGAQHGAGS
jgi:hypothetical protein